MSASAILEVRDLTVAYGAIQAVKGVSLTLSEGEIVTLIGANGAGKTTTLRAIMGLVPCAGGEVRYRGQPTRAIPTHRLVRDGLVLVPEGRIIFANLSVQENLEMGAYSRRDRGIASDFERVFTLFPRLKERRLQTAGTLSGGEQQMLAIGRALMSKPAVLLLDEPSLGLAPIVVHAIFELFPNLKERLSSQGTKLSGGEQQMLAIGRILRTGARLLLLDEPTEGLAPVIVQQIGRTIARLKAEGFTILLVEQNFRFASTVADRHYVVEHGRVIDQFANRDLPANTAKIQEYLGV